MGACVQNGHIIYATGTVPRCRNARRTGSTRRRLSPVDLLQAKNFDALGESRCAMRPESAPALLARRLASREINVQSSRSNSRHVCKRARHYDIHRATGSAAITSGAWKGQMCGERFLIRPTKRFPHALLWKFLCCSILCVLQLRGLLFAIGLPAFLLCSRNSPARLFAEYSFLC